MNTKNPFYILSVYQGIEKDQKNHVDTLVDLKVLGVPCKEVDGCYKGKTEKSILISVKNHQSSLFLALLVKQIAKKYNQESILLVSNGFAELVYTSGHIESLGYFEQTSEFEAITQDAYTYDKDTGKYYTVKYTKKTAVDSQ